MAQFKVLPQFEHIDDGRFVGSHGGPILVVPKAHVQMWWGCYDEHGEHVFGRAPTDYDRACEDGDLPFTIPLRDAPEGDPQRWALVLEAPDNSAFHPTEDGVLVVRWVGADTAAGLLSVALQVPDSEWERDVLELEVAPGGLCMFDSSGDGRRPDAIDNGVAEVDLAPGRYTVDRIVEIETDVEHRDGTVEDLMVQLVRLRRAP
jgi:hypothetical protein